MAISYTPYENQPVVIDLGSHSLKFGYSGESRPVRVFPSVAGVPSTKELKNEQHNNLTNLNLIYPLSPCEKRDHMDLIYFSQPSITITETATSRTKAYGYSLLEKILDATISSKGLNDSLSDHPILLTEPNKTNQQYRENVLETIFESFQVPSALLCKTAPLMCYAVARSSGVVLDIGASGTDTSFVSEGYVIPKSIIESPVGGDFIDQWLIHMLEKKYNISPFFTLSDNQNHNILDILGGKTIKSPIPTPFVNNSYTQWGKQYVCACIKENLKHFLIDDTDSSLCLPDGKKVEVNDLLKIEKSMNEILFTPSILPDSECAISCFYQNPMALSVTQFGSRETKSSSLLKKANNLSVKSTPPSSFLNNQVHTHPMTDYSTFLRGFTGITDQIYSSLESSDRSTGNLSADGLIVGGGSTLFPGFIEKLQQDIENNKKFRHLPNQLSICASSTLKERHYSSWIGGSIISCLGSFPQFCISVEEYNEFGAISAAEKKCP